MMYDVCYMCVVTNPYNPVCICVCTVLTRVLDAKCMKYTEFIINCSDIISIRNGSHRKIYCKQEIVPDFFKKLLEISNFD